MQPFCLMMDSSQFVVAIVWCRTLVKTMSWEHFAGFRMVASSLVAFRFWWNYWICASPKYLPEDPGLN